MYLFFIEEKSLNKFKCDAKSLWHNEMPFHKDKNAV